MPSATAGLFVNAKYSRRQWLFALECTEQFAKAQIRPDHACAAKHRSSPTCVNALMQKPFKGCWDYLNARACSISTSIRHVVASPCRAFALSAASRLMSYRSENEITRDRCTSFLYHFGDLASRTISQVRVSNVLRLRSPAPFFPLHAACACVAARKLCIPATRADRSSWSDSDGVR